MRKLSFILIILSSLAYAQSPHGPDFNLPCANCHSTQSWAIDKDSLNFDHATTGFELMGNHFTTDCASCHEDLKFSQTPTDCFSCHTDMHQGTVGQDCESCHTPHSWIVTDIAGIHERSRFPLIGAHNNDDCQQCHMSESLLNFEPLGIECYDCHSQEYQATSSPNHITAGFSTDCVECHNLTSTDWAAGDFRHDFFPLTGGHDVGNCFECHQTGTFEGLSPECITCHTDDFNNVIQPNHVQLGFSQDCTECHSTNPGWRPANFTQHDEIFPLTGAHNLIRNDCASCHSDGYNNTPNECVGCHQSDYNGATNPNHSAAGFSTDCESCHSTSAWVPATFDHDNEFFPIYSGEHRGEWNSCADCHTDPNNFAAFECITCHEHNQTEMNSEHSGINGYMYQSQACYDCHPTGNGDGAFNHSGTNFPLTGSHVSASCSDCHTSGYSGTSMECASCHQAEFDGTSNPNHSSAGFSTDCETCHTSSGWTPAQFDHDGQYFPIYSGEHNNEWNNCADCHTDQSNFMVFECITCHEHNQGEMDSEHQGVSGYVYQSAECYACHPSGSEDGAFNHTTSNFPLTGSHMTTECSSCHVGQYQPLDTQCESCHLTDYNQAPNHSQQNYPLLCESCHNAELWTAITYDHNQTNFPLTGGHTGADCQTCHDVGLAGTSTTCVDCHISDFDGSINPSHQQLGLTQNCEECHTTAADWRPATFSVHNDFYLLTGAHSTISTDCASCHNGDYVNTSQDCVGCHQNDYDLTSEPPHQGAGFNTVCEDCHTSTAWQPAQFDHDGQYFPIYSGEHNQEWSVCADCHTNSQNYAVFECTTCHEHNQQEMDQEHNDVQGYIYVSQECFACHPDGSEDGSFNHITSNFPLTGNHLTANCQDCHDGGYQNTPTECQQCHNDVYTGAINPNHTEAGLGQNCEECHSSNGWTPSTFMHSSTGFELTGAHVTPQCSSCHVGTTAGLTGVCYDCHLDVYTTAPDHLAQNYPQDCTVCHSTTAWDDATFNHDNTAFPLTGGHLATACNDCHESGYAGTSSVCIDCHLTEYQATTNPDHEVLSLSQDCETCHTTSVNWEPATFTVHNDFFQLLGAHSAIANSCDDCHSGDYNNTPNLCFGCHESDYNSANNPNHLGAGFPTNCEECHTQSAWTPSNFNHDSQYFPIYSGEHNNEWDNCSDCHTNPGNFAVFSCITCHEHRQSEMDDEHDDVPGYIYNSQACFDCHPDGDEKINVERILPKSIK